jgi:hypothetical protein
VNFPEWPRPPEERLSEKTLELSILAQLAERLGLPNVLWWGLTQGEEARWGFDAANEIGGEIFFFQFKRSNDLIPRRNPISRRFQLPHEQMANLVELERIYRGAVYYVLPHIGTWREFQENPDLVSQTWALGVSQLDGLPRSHRKDGSHQAVMAPPRCEIHSEVVRAKVESLETLANSIRSKTKERPRKPLPLQPASKARRGMPSALANLLGRGLYGLVVPRE